MKAFILLSGGIDSMACTYYYLKLGYEVEGVFCNYGQPAFASEYNAAKSISNYYSIPLHVITTTGTKDSITGEICGRNALLVVEALFHIGFGEYKIILGIHDGTGYSDCSRLFVDEINRVLDLYSGGTIVTEAPFVDLYKSEIIQFCKDNKLPIELTYSCENGTVPPCGACPSCLDRKELLNE